MAPSTMMDNLDCKKLINHKVISLRACDERIHSSPPNSVVIHAPSSALSGTTMGAVAVDPNRTLVENDTATVDTNATINELKEQVDALQRQLDQARAENVSKDRTISSLRQQMQRQERISSQPTTKGNIQMNDSTTPETAMLSSSSPPQSSTSNINNNNINNLDSKLGKFYCGKLFQKNQHDISAIQNDVDAELRNFFEEKLLLGQQEALPISAAATGGKCNFVDDNDDDGDESSSCTSDMDGSSLNSGLSSTTHSFSILQRQCLERIQNQKGKDLRSIDTASSDNHPNSSDSTTHHDLCTSVRSVGVGDVVDQIQRWLFLEGGNLRDVPSLLTEYCNFCRTHCDLPHLDRLYVAGLMLPPQVSAYVWKWEHGKEFQEREVPHSAFEMPNFNPDDPFSALTEGRVMEYRIKAGRNQPIPPDCAWFTEEEYQDYLALPIYFRGKFVGAMSWATKCLAGFSNQDIQVFYESLASLSTVLRLHTNDIIMSTLQERLNEHVQNQTSDLAKANRRLAAANAKVTKQAQDQLKHFAMMSHEIRTPLNCIVGLSNLLLDNPERPLDPEVEESVSMITASGDLLLAVVDDVLDYSKLATGNVEIEIGPTDIRKTVRPVVESIRMKAASMSKEHKLELRTSISDDLPNYVDVDGRRLQQILYNLLGNAIKFGKRGSHVDFSVTIKRDSTMTTNRIDNHAESEELCDAEAFVIFSIKDYGNGIADKDMKTIFQPFQQASSNDAADGGTGLGLAITSQLCKVLGGSISVTSEEGKGSEFVVQLPLIESKHVPTKQSSCEVDLECLDDDDRRGSFRLSLLTKNSSSRKLTASLLSNFHSSSRSFPSSPRVLQRSKSEESLTDLPSVPYNSPRRTFSAVVNPTRKPPSPRRSYTTKGAVLEISETKATEQSSHKIPALHINAENTPHTNKLAPGHSVTLSPFETARVLIAEDNLVNQKVLTRTLTKLGMKNIVVVPNGEEAVKISAEQTFDVIFMDWCMPIMDGLEATKLIIARRTAHPEATHPRIVFLTAHALEDYREKAIEAGGDGFISKPFKVAAIKDFLDKFKVGQTSS